MSGVGTTYPRGFRAAGVTCGIKASGAPDLALVVNDGPSPASAGVFTSNRVSAAPVRLTRAHLAAATLRAVILNSGCANACTGERGARDARRTAARVAELLGLSDQQIGVCSTGLIGDFLPMAKLMAGAARAAAALAPDGGGAAAEAIRTTDTHAKTVQAGPGAWRIGGMAKGAGMLAPGLATMLVVLTTDAAIDSEEARGALARAAELTFNRTDSDGCMSTNDTVLLLASGASGAAPAPQDFTRSLTDACGSLAAQLIGDAEGSSHDIAVHVRGADSEAAALAVARAIARSNLFKAAVFGQDPNWGRVVSEAGAVPESVAPFDPDRLDVVINGVTVCRASTPAADRDAVDMSGRRVDVTLDLHAGGRSATIWTNDLTHDYVTENSAYSS